MAGLKESILSLKAKCQTIAGINYVAIWNNQLDDEAGGKTYDFPKPAIFIEAQTPNAFLPLGVGYSQADITFVFHLVHEEFDANDGTLDENKNVFDIRAAVIAALNGFKPTNGTPLMKTSEMQDYAHNNIYHYQIGFICGIIDDAGASDKGDTVKNPPTDLEVDATIEAAISGEQNQPVRIWPAV